MAKVGIVIVNYNGEKYQEACMESLYALDYQDFEIIVVDSNSKDNSVKILKERFPKVHVLEQNENVGVAKGNNIGIEYSLSLNTEYTLLMNNDVELDSKLLGIMVQQMEIAQVVVPKIYYYEPNDLIWFGGGKLDWKKGSAVHFGIHDKDCGQYDKKMNIDYAPTCCMLIKNDVFKKVGMIREELFMYYDDTDFCARLYEAQIPILYCPEAYMWHKVSSSSGGEDSKISVYYMYRNQLYYMKLHSSLCSVSSWIYAVSRGIAKFVLSPFKCRNNKFIFTAYTDYICKNMGRKDF